MLQADVHACLYPHMYVHGCIAIYRRMCISRFDICRLRLLIPTSPLFVSSLGCRFPACTSCLGSNARLMFSRSRQIRRLSGRSITSSEGQDIGFGLRVPEVRGGTQATSHAGDFSCTSHGMPGIVSFSCMASAAKALHRERSRPPFSCHELDKSAARWGLTRNLKVIRPQGLSKVQSPRPV